MSYSPVFEAFMLGFAPDPYLMIDEWADRYRQLPKGASAEAGQYNTDRMPYLREIMQELSPQSPTQQVKVIKATQLGFTEVANNVAMYYMDVVPTSQLMVLPTETLTKAHSNKKLTPSLRAMPSLGKKITGGKTKDDIGGTFEKNYPGGSLNLAWAGSAANFRSLSVRVLNLDDVDGFPSDVEDEGNPLDLAKKRTDSFGILRKIYINGTPTLKGNSNIEAEFEDSDQRHFYMPCPHCGKFITFEFDSMKFTYDKETYRLSSEVECTCSKCGGFFKEHHKTKMLNLGKWIPHNKGHEHKGYRLNSFYSPLGFVSWREVISEFLEAKKYLNRGDNRKMKTWKNTREAKPWEEDIITVKVDNIEARKEDYIAQVPDEVQVITAGVDTQDDRFEIEVVGFGKDEESWSIDYHVIHHDPKTKEAKDMLDEYLKRTYKTSDGKEMKIFATAIDTGGHRTKAVYEFCENKFLRRVYAIKGANTIDAPFIKTRPSKQGRTKLFTIGVNAGKDDIYARLEIKEKGAGYMHFPNKEIYDDAYFKQLTAEKRDKNGRWINFRHRNEAIDCRNYANAALGLAGVTNDMLLKDKKFGVITDTPVPKRRRIIRRGIR